VKHHEPRRGFVLPPRRWVVERTFGWLARFQRPAQDYGGLSKTLERMHRLAFMVLLLSKVGVQSA